MTEQDNFATAAMQAAIMVFAKDMDWLDANCIPHYSRIAERSYEMAAAMMRERKRLYDEDLAPLDKHPA